jgi:hypothetical protein
LSRLATSARVTSDVTAKYYANVPGGHIKSPSSGIVARLDSLQGKQILAELSREQSRVAAAEESRRLAEQARLDEQVRLAEQPAPELAIEKPTAFTYKPEPTVPEYKPKTSAQIATEGKSITAEVKKLETERTRIDKLQKSMVTRTMPSTNIAIRKYNKAISDIRSRAADYEREAIISKFDVEAAERGKIRREFPPLEKIRTVARLEKIGEVSIVGVPLRKQFGLEAASAALLGVKYEREAAKRIFGGEIPGLPGKYALQKATIAKTEAKLPFSSTGPASFLGPTKGELESLPIVKGGVGVFERPGRAKVKLLAERGDIFGAYVSTAELIGRKGVEVLVPPGKESVAGLGLLPKEATPPISFIRGAFGLPTLKEGEQFALFGGTREELIQKGGLAGTLLSEFALFDVGGRAAIKGLAKIKKPSRVVLKEPEIFLSLPAAESEIYTLGLRTKGVSRLENLKRILTGKQKIKPIEVTIAGQKAAEWPRPVSELTFGARVSTAKGQEKIVSELITGAYPKGVTPASLKQARKFLKTEAFTGKISFGKGKPIEFWQKGVPIETSLKVRTVYKPKETEQFLKYYVDLTGEAAGKPYAGRLWQDIFAKTPVKGAKAAGFGKIGGVFKTEKGAVVELRKASLEFLQALPSKPPSKVVKFVGKKTPLGKLYGKESLLPQYPLYKRAGREIELIPSRARGSVTVLKTRAEKELAPFLSGFKASEAVAPLALKAAEEAKYVSRYVPASYAALAVGLPRVVKTPTERVFEEEMKFLMPVERPSKPTMQKEFAYTGFEIDQFEYAKPKAGILPGFEYAAAPPKERFEDYLGVSARTKDVLVVEPVKKLKPAEKTILDVVPKVKVSEKEVSKTMERIAQRFKTSFKETPSLAVRVTARARTAEQQAMRFVMPPVFVKVPKPPRVPPIFSPPFVPLPSFKKPLPVRGLAGFIPITRRAGKEVALTDFPVSKEAARAIAIANVVASPRASFKLLKAKGPPVKVAYPKLPAGVMQMFRPAKTLPGFYVEKMKYRIDQPGEFAGITAKGLEALASPFARKRKKKKTKKKGVWLF